MQKDMTEIIILIKSRFGDKSFLIKDKASKKDSAKS